MAVGAFCILMTTPGRLSEAWSRLPSSEEHWRPLVDTAERTTTAPQRLNGWEAARGAADRPDCWSPGRGSQTFGQMLETDG